jgi:hypothetical protein
MIELIPWSCYGLDLRSNSSEPIDAQGTVSLPDLPRPRQVTDGKRKLHVLGVLRDNKSLVIQNSVLLQRSQDYGIFAGRRIGWVEKNYIKLQSGLLQDFQSVLDSRLNQSALAGPTQVKILQVLSKDLAGPPR